MRGYNYHFSVNPVKQTIKLRPTLGTYAKALMPSFIVFGGLFAAGKVAEAKAEKEIDNLDKTDFPTSFTS